MPLKACTWSKKGVLRIGIKGFQMPLKACTYKKKGGYYTDFGIAHSDPVLFAAFWVSTGEILFVRQVRVSPATYDRER